MEINTNVNIATAKQMLRYNFGINEPTFLWGAPGVGKSEAVHQIANEDNIGMVDFRAVLRNPVDLLGVPMPNPKTKRTEWYSPDDLPNEKRDGKEGILFLDELNAANPQVQAACYGLVLDRKLGDYRLPDGWRIVAAGNRVSDRSAAQRMQRALANRFDHIDVMVDPKQWVEDYANKYLDPLMAAFIRFRPAMLHEELLLEEEKGDDRDERRFPTPRSWASANKMIPAPANIRSKLIAGRVGQAGALEFEGFLKTVRELPDIGDIISDPKGCDVPDDPGALYALSTGLARHADRGNFGSIMTYAQRLGREHEIIVGLDSTGRDSALTKTKAYIAFTERNPDLQIGSF